MYTVPKLSRRDFAIISFVSMATAIGNTGLHSVLPSIGRSIGIADTMVAAIFSLSSFLWAVASPFWARQSDLQGRKPLIIAGLGGFAVSMMFCGAVVSVGLAHLTAPITIFWLFLVGRAIFGLFGAASAPATLAYVAERTLPDERTRCMSKLAGAFSLGTVIGPVVAPIFIVGVIGFAGPLYAFGFIAMAMLIIATRCLNESPVRRPNPPPRTTKRAHTRLWRQSKFRPFIAYGFLVLVCQIAQTQTLGFLIIDKAHKAFPELSAPALLSLAQGYIQVAMVAGAASSLLALWGFIPLLRITPKALLRWGAGLAAIGSALIAFSPGYATAIVGYAVSSLGFALARPGFTAGASLSVSRDEQAEAAGMIGAINGITGLLTPFAVSLYEIFAPGPFLLEAFVLAGLVGYAYANPTLRKVGCPGGGRDNQIEAALPRNDK